MTDTEHNSQSEGNIDHPDIYVLNSPISRKTSTELLDIHAAVAARTSCTLVVMSTAGGDPHAAYIMSKYLQTSYSNGFTALVCGPCKSAGTLLVLGARSIAIGRHGELGPLDIQVTKKDERYDRESGLDMLSALDILTNVAITTFNEHVPKVELRTLVSTRLAAEMTTNLVATVVSPIAKRIDPIGLGGRQRALDIVRAYGMRLGVTDDVLDVLVTSYPDHGFVITFDEAKALLGDRVRQPDKTELSLETALRTNLPKGIVLLNPQINEKETTQDAEEKQDRDSNQTGANGEGREDGTNAP